MSRRYLALAAFVAASAVSSSAHAQLGKLTKKATSAAANAAGVNTTPPRLVDNLDLTSAQLKQINAGLTAEIAATPNAVKDAEAAQKNAEKAQQQYEKDNAAYTKADEKYESCKEKVIAELEPSRAAAQQKAEKASDNAGVGDAEQAALEKQAMAAQAAAERIQAGKGTAADQQTMADFQKTMAGVSSRGMGAVSAANEAAALNQATITKIDKTCGVDPVAPKAPSSAANTAAEVILDAGAKASGLANYKIMREKAEGYAASNTQVKGGKVPAEEADAINSELAITRQKMAEMQKAGTPM